MPSWPPWSSIGARSSPRTGSPTSSGATGLPANPTGALQAYVSHLRRRLQPEAGARRRDGVIVRAGGGYLLRLAPDAVDAWSFERAVDSAAGMAPADAARVLDDALRLWRGPAYAEYAGEPWAEAEVTRLSELRAVARERLLDARLQLGDAALLVGDLEALVAEDPLREERWRLLVLALYRAQRQADALAALRRARELLAEELGVDPGPALRALEAEVLAQSPALDAPLVATPAPASALPCRRRADRPGRPDAGDGGARSARSTELAAARPGASSSKGRPGSARPGCSWRPCVSPTSPGRGCWPRGPASWSARTASASSGSCSSPPSVTRARQDVLLDAAAGGARVVFDGLAGAEGPSHGNFAVLHGLYWLTVNLAGDGPLVISVDDAQWCDAASLRFLAYLVKRLEGLPVLVVMTVRSGEEGPDDSLLAELALDPSVTVLRPRPLSAEAAGTLVRELLGEGADSFVRACHRMTSGNPLLLRQLLRALEEEGVRPDVSHVDTVRAIGSRAVSSLVMLRLRRMPPAVTAVARAVAVLGEEAQLPPSPSWRGCPRRRPPRRSTRSAVGRSSRTGCRWRSSTRSSATPCTATCLPPTARCTTSALPSCCRSRAPRRRSVAAHLLLAPAPRQRGRRWGCSAAAARTAMARGASDSAVVLLRRALDEPVPTDTRAEVLIELGLVETLVDGPASAAHLTEAYELVEDPHERARIAMLVVRTHVFASPPGVATAFALEAEAALPDGSRRRAAGAGRAAAHVRVHAPAPARVLSLRAGPRGQWDGRRGAGCSRPRSATSGSATARTAPARSSSRGSRSRATDCWRSTTACSGSSPRTSCCSPTRTSATSGTAPWPARTPRAVCSRCCR